MQYCVLGQCLFPTISSYGPTKAAKAIIKIRRTKWQKMNVTSKMCSNTPNYGFLNMKDESQICFSRIRHRIPSRCVFPAGAKCLYFPNIKNPTNTSCKNNAISEPYHQLRLKCKVNWITLTISLKQMR